MTDTSSPSTGRLAGRIALITGASRGIGLAVAKRFAAEGAHLVLIARTQGALEELDDDLRAAGHEAPTLVPLDLLDFDSIDQVGAALYQRFGKLDILVGNAGLLESLTPMHQIDPKEWDKVMGVNLTANFRLIRAMDPLLRQSDAGRAIFLSSGTTKAPRVYWATYGVSKMALEYMVRSYALEVEKITNIKANLIDPGSTRTRMRASAYPGEDPDSLKTPEMIAGTFVEMASPEWESTGEVVRLDASGKPE
ncbi:SDR family NAD(P)-dependent oxidoreductase [Magnetospira sp. QH-2]|uniref:SDR family NAD(P)-dependent oxidoreductase n=1 Tax=Magnetospira sp. (strain QH-2) TaxID=1288970 RepID=UPI0003E81937|nr:SDR family NAD(P)-dependent oxidoreductase [Magnetospira sp. QH-2]CCQ74071.1 Putative Short-chain dehydrogenase/reductase SDR [Magnetospira sp. QH-2]